jgi:hypothetical protein
MNESRRRMGPWTIDASGVDIAHLSEVPYCREALRMFLNSKVGSLERVLVAPKGYGKTLYLKYKSHQIRHAYRNSIPIFPDTRQDIEFLKLSLDWKEMAQDVGRLSIDNWSVLWQFVLISKGLQLVDAVEQVDGYLKDFLRSTSEPIGDMLSAAIRDRDNFGANTAQRLRIVRKLFNDTARDAVVFVDNADEMFVGLDRMEQLREAKHKAPSAHDDSRVAHTRRAVDSAISAEVAQSNPAMWKAAQVGLLLAVREIERSAPSLSVYTTLRAEAVYSAEHPDALQARTYIVPIRYSEEDLEEIFAWHVNMMGDDALVDAEASHSADRLMGSELIEHRYVRINGDAVREKPFDLVLRHTTFSPRDLVAIGGHIAKLSVAERSGVKRAERIRKAIDSAAAELLIYFRENAIPKWSGDWEQALRRLDAPVLDRAQVDQQLGVAAAKLHSYGLLGIAEPTGRAREYTQYFLTQWDEAYAANELPLPKSDYYFLHPWVFDSVKRFNPNFTRDPNNIVGNGCPFRLPGPLALTVGRDANNDPAIWCEGEMDSPGATARGLKLPMGAVFMFSFLFACHHSSTARLTRAQIDAGREDFARLFPSHQEADTLDPFGNGDHRSHLQGTVLKHFPLLKDKVLRRQGTISCVSARSGSEAYVDSDFVDVERLRLDC